MFKVSVIFFIFFGLTGCATKFSCTNESGSNNEGCEPISYVYHSMDDGYYDYRKDMVRKNKSHSDDKKDDVEIKISQSNNVINYRKAGNPILSKPITARILFTNWLDKQNDFNEGGFTYIKLQDSKWLTQD